MNELLYHYGIKGMRWGVRRTPEQLGHGPKAPPNAKDPHNKINQTKLKGEIKRLEAWRKEDPTKEELKDCARLQNEIHKKSGNWYNDKAVSEGFAEKNAAIQSAERQRRDAEKRWYNRYEQMDYDAVEKYYQEFEKAGLDMDEAVRMSLEKARSSRPLPDNEPEISNKIKAEIKQASRDAKRAKNELCGQVLRDIGFEDTPKSRELIYTMVFDD